jgi:predicted kinase
MKISIVIGLPGSGKSTYIKNNFKDRVVVDLWDFQENITFNSTLEEGEATDKACREEFLKAIKEGHDVVLEHTLIKAFRRKLYIDAVKEITNEPIECIFINPPREVIVERQKERQIFYGDWYLNAYYGELEIPTIEEGFSNVETIIA